MKLGNLEQIAVFTGHFATVSMGRADAASSLIVALELDAQRVMGSSLAPRWTCVPCGSFDGTDSATSPNIGDSETAGSEIVLAEPDTVPFYWRVSLEENADSSAGKDRGWGDVVRIASMATSAADYPTFFGGDTDEPVPIVPEVAGMATSFSVSEDLPPGLQLDSVPGEFLELP